MKKQYLLVLILLTFVLNIKGQDNSYSAGFVGSIEVSFLDFNDSYESNNYEYQSNFGFLGGMEIQISLFEKAFLKSGFTYSSRGHQKIYNFEPQESKDPLIPDLTNVGYSYINIPIMIGYKVTNFGKLHIKPLIGLNTGFLIGTSETTTYGDNSQKETEFFVQDLNKVLYILQMDYGFEYYTDKNIIMGFYPYWGKGLNKINDKMMNSTQFVYGLKFGVLYVF